MTQKYCFLILITLCFFVKGQSQDIKLHWDTKNLGYHPIKTNSDNNTILPWYDDNPGKSYNFIINQVWNFWDTMRIDYNGLPYYMNHQVWRSDFNDNRGIGGDQLAMALSSWQLYYNYSGNERVKETMKFIADYYLSIHFHLLMPTGQTFHILTIAICIRVFTMEIWL